MATPVVTCVLRNEGEVLLFRRSDAVGSHRGLWGVVAGHADGDPDAAARQEVREEMGVDPDRLALVRTGEPFEVGDEEGEWLVHPSLFDCPTRAVEHNRETEGLEWAPPTAILRRETVPRLWMSSDRVRPRVETVAGDTDHGAAYVSVRALEVLRDEAAVARSVAEVRVRLATATPVAASRRWPAHSRRPGPRCPPSPTGSTARSTAPAS